MGEGNVEGIVITGLGKQGIELLQAYVDKYSDVWDFVVQGGVRVGRRVPPSCPSRMTIAQ